MGRKAIEKLRDMFLKDGNFNRFNRNRKSKTLLNLLNQIEESKERGFIQVHGYGEIYYNSLRILRENGFLFHKSDKELYTIFWDISKIVNIPVIEHICFLKEKDLSGYMDLKKNEEKGLFHTKIIGELLVYQYTETRKYLCKDIFNDISKNTFFKKSLNNLVEVVI